MVHRMVCLLASRCYNINTLIWKASCQPVLAFGCTVKSTYPIKWPYITHVGGSYFPRCFVLVVGYSRGKSYGIGPAKGRMVWRWITYSGTVEIGE